MTDRVSFLVQDYNSDYDVYEANDNSLSTYGRPPRIFLMGVPEESLRPQGSSTVEQISA